MKKDGGKRPVSPTDIMPPTENNVSGNVYLYLRDLITSGKLPAGYVFPNENDLCRLLNVGRSTLREAYMRLATQNLITRSKAGTTVNSPEAIRQAIPFTKLVEHSDFWDTMDFRLLLEQEIAILAAERATAEDTAALREIVAHMRAHTDEIVAFSLYDAEFHVALAKAARNELLTTVVDVVRKSLESAIYGAFAFEPGMMPGAVDYHEQILATVEAHDPEAAKAAMRAHLSNVVAVVQKSKGADGEPAGRRG